MAYGVRNDEELGRFLYENEVIEALEDFPDKSAAYLNYEKIGRERRLAEGGVFTSHGYVPDLIGDDLPEVYTPGFLASPEELLPEESLRVEFFKYDFTLR